jgi:NAD(P)-dependent dehydrogenase (short-subunit alcohol dehydrogenase family)
MERNLIIFGYTGQLGRGITRVLVKKNYDRIYLIDRTENEDIPSGSSLVKIVSDDLTKEENIKEAFSKIEIGENGLYFLFSTIGGFSGGNIEDTGYDSWNKMFALNVNISFLIGKYFSQLTSASKGGSICFTSAATSLNAERGKAAYGASKSALNYLVKTMAAEGKDLKLTANAIAPFVLDTEANREWVTDESIMVKPEDIGELLDSIFNNFEIVSGNIIELPGTLNLGK